MAGAVVLVADDERNIQELARLYLTNDGFQVETAANGREALEKARANSPSLILLDLMMPEMDGWEVCRALRRESNVPIIFLTARADDVDKVVGLELGADDYITKPFNPRELVARVKSVLRRTSSTQVPTRVLTLADLRVDLDRREVHLGGRVLALRPKEFELLALLASAPGIVFPRVRLLQQAWGYEYFGDSRTIDVHVTWLREKLSGSGVRIQTARGVGYKLVEATPNGE
ncbi:MAG: response regulator transcription factor [Chloroflexota bacterium]